MSPTAALPDTLELFKPYYRRFHCGGGIYFGVFISLKRQHTDHKSILTIVLILPSALSHTRNLNLKSLSRLGTLIWNPNLVLKHQFKILLIAHDDGEMKNWNPHHELPTKTPFTRIHQTAFRTRQARFPRTTITTFRSFAFERVSHI